MQPQPAKPSDEGPIRPRLRPAEISGRLSNLRKAPASGPGQRTAAVFALLVQRQEAQVLLIRRAERGDPWSGQIALPGGHVHSDDGSPLDTAYRETQEEVGIASEAITCLGELGVFNTRTGNIRVRAFVGLWDGLAAPRANPAEVAEVFEAPLSLLLGQHHHEGFAGRTTEEIGGELIYPIDQGVIWGVTARIMHALIELLGQPSAAAGA